MSRPPEQQNTLSPRWWRRLCQWLRPKLQWFWTAIVLVLALNIATAWFTTKGFNISGTPLEWIRDHFLLALASGGLLLVLTTVVYYFGRPVASPARVLPTSQDRRALIRRLNDEYRRQQIQSLQEAAMMSLEGQEPAAVTLSSASLVSWQMDVPGKASLAAPTPIVQAYDQASAGLLILGDPGVGKSTLLLELALGLLTRAEQDPAQPVPVLVNLSSWALNKPLLTTWLEEQLYSMCGIPRHLSHSWIEQNKLVLLLDGLDEMEPSARSSCIVSINDYRDRAEHVVPLVVCSRRDEYLAQEKRLRLLATVEVQRLTPEQVDGYLKRVGKPLTVVRTALRSNAVLRELVTTPLMLNVVMLAYRGKTVKDLPQFGSAEDQQRQVFAQYVTRMLERPTRKWHYTPDSTQKWIIWLAQQMKLHQLTEFYLEYLQPTWLSTKRPRIVYALISGLGVGPVFGLFFGPVFGLVGGLLAGLVGGLVYGLVFGLLGVLLVGVLAGLAGWLGRLNREKVPRSGRRFRRGLLSRNVKEHWEIRPAEKLTWSWRRFWRGLIPEGLGIGGFFELLYGLVGGLLGWLSGELLSGLVSGLFFGLLFGLAVGLFSGLAIGLSNEQIDEHERLRPNQGIRTSGRNALRSGLLGGLVVGLAAGLLGGLVFGLLIGLLIGLVFGLFFGLVFGLDYGGIAYLQHYCLHFLLWRSGAIPWRYVRFLEEATERILLQRVGGGYRFIHPLFLDYFASLSTAASPPSVQPPL